MGGALGGVRVLEVEGGLAVRLLGLLLADQGAEVVRIGAPSRPTRAEAALGRGRLELDPVDDAERAELIARCDVVIGGASARIERPRRVIAARLPSFAADDPCHGLPGQEGLIGAATALHGLPGLPWPAYGPVPVASVLAALYAASAVGAALWARRRTGRGVDVEVPVADAALTAQGLGALLSHRPPPCWRSLQWAASPLLGAWTCADGRELYLHAGLPAHLERLLEVLQADGMIRAVRDLRRTLSEGTRADPSSVPTPAEARALRTQLAAVFRERPAAAWEQLLGDAGLAVAMVRSAAEWRDHPHALAAGLMVHTDDPVWGPLLAPGPAVRNGGEGARPRQRSTVDEVLARWGAVSAEGGVEGAADGHDGEGAVGDGGGAPLAGQRVLDVTQVIAGPMATRTLAELGAEVLRVENPRLTAAWGPAFHVAYDAGKESVALDLSTEAGRAALAALIERWRPDVVVHNFRDGAAERLGLGEDAVRAVLPDVVYVHLDAFGGPGPWAGRPGWEQTAQAACGIQLDAGDGKAELLPLPGNDLGTGLAGAFGAVLGLLDPAARRAHTCLALTAELLQLPWIVEPAGRAAPRTRGTRSLGSGPGHRYYRARDGWMFLAVERLDDLAGVAGLAPIAAVDPRARETWLEARLAEETVGTWRARVEAAGLRGRVGIVARRSLAEVLDDPRAYEVGLVVRRGNAAVGEVTEVRTPVRLDGARSRLGPASPRGADTAAVLAELGIDGGLETLGQVAPVGRAARLRWAVDQARWGLHLMGTRLG